VVAAFGKKEALLREGRFTMTEKKKANPSRGREKTVYRSPGLAGIRGAITRLGKKKPHISHKLWAGFGGDPGWTNLLADKSPEPEGRRV